MATDDARDAVLDSARAAFHAKGYARTSLKAIAAAAGVAPDVVGKYYNSKEKLFQAAMTLPFDPAASIQQLVAPGLDGMGERLTRVALESLGDPETRDDLIALARAGASTTKAAAGLKSFVEEGIVDRLALVMGVPDARLRANLITSYLLGIAINRYVVKLEPIASMSEDDVVRLVSPTIQDWLTPTHALPGSAQEKAQSAKADAEKSAAQRAEAEAEKAQADAIAKLKRQQDPFEMIKDFPTAE